ncbi:MAG: tRNA 2-thiouridine(34) synthase MnmA [Coriobacteriales bacterium]|jgi:tRNA-specific 2-thiouridylase|nr:tRNA 2-thiouridine(34) synthase MnmA [Coriobacteriales bacterium]
MPRVLVAMSGGVDSSVALLLMLEAGYHCDGVTLKLHDAAASSIADAPDTVDAAPVDAAAAPAAAAPADASLEDAALVCAQFGVEHRTLDLRELFAKKVIAPFINSYAQGETPNPCIDCNREIKFGALLDYAIEQGFDYLATGHYARISYEAKQSIYRLLKAVDSTKDQSYMLYQLGQDELSHLRFPLGELTKNEVRELAVAAGLPTATKAESQDICFIPDNDYQGFIREFSTVEAKPGEIVDSHGKLLGYYQSIADFTIGQRRGLGVAVGHPLYVTDIDAVNHRVTVEAESGLLHMKVLLRDIYTPDHHALQTVTEVTAKYRYRTPEAVARLVMMDNGRFEVHFAEPQKALTPGQSMVCYQGEQVVAGGVIAKVRG